MSLPALYELSTEFMRVARELEDMDLDAQVVADTLEGLQFPLEVKATNVAMYSRNLESTADSIDTAIETMQGRAAAIRKRAASLRDYLQHNMERTGITKIESPHFVISLKKKPQSVEIYNADLLPADYMRQPVTPPPAPDKKLIAQAIKDGYEVAGAKMSEQTNRLEIK